MPEFLTTAELAALLRVAPETCRYWRWRGEGPRATKAGRRVLYSRTDVDAWLAANREPEHAA